MLAGEYESGSVALVNGRVFTADPARPAASAVGIWRGRVAYVGDDADQARAAAGQDAEVIDLAGRLATPGLIDAHCHPLLYGEQLLGLDLTTARSVAELLARVRERAATTPAGQQVSGWGYYRQSLAEQRLPTLTELDAAAPEHLVALTHRSGHELLVNSAVLRAAGYTRDTPDPFGGYLERDAAGALTGLLAETAMAPVEALAPEPGPAEIDARLRRAVDQFLAYGITSATDASVNSGDVVQAYQRLRADCSRPRTRFNLMLGHRAMLEPAEALGLQTGLGDDWLRVAAIKFFLDGTEGQRTAKVSEPFADDPGNTGLWMFPPEEFRERVMRAHLAGLQCAVHAIGDAAVELTLDAYRDAQAKLPRPGIRHRVEHASLLRPDLIERFAREGVIPVPGARFASNDYQVLIERFGPERLRWYQPWNALLERNVPVAVSSDAPVQSADPAKNLWAIVNSRAEHDPSLVMQPDERVSLDETLLAYTRHGAWATHQEGRKGTLRPGLLGDVTVFNANLFEVDPLALDTIHADITIVDGVVAYRGPRGT
ncbi:MAG TPA: amidohydrolase [Thermomicrobiales bacterium]|nr:amidohydrolase [Thermomicrobiales bacterium]